MASPALCIMYIPHLSDTYPLGSLLYIPCSFNVLPENLICCSFRERLHAQNFLHLNMDIVVAQWLELQLHSKRVLGIWRLAGTSLCEVCVFSPCLWVSSGCTGSPPQSKWKYASWRWTGNSKLYSRCKSVCYVPALFDPEQDLSICWNKKS